MQIEATTDADGVPVADPAGGRSKRSRQSENPDSKAVDAIFTPFANFIEQQMAEAEASAFTGSDPDDPIWQDGLGQLNQAIAAVKSKFLERQAAASAARAAEQAGARMVVMHGRSRACKFAGAVRFAAVAEASRDLSIPVFANGDIDDAQSAAQALAQSGADGIMIGRGAIGQPWIFQELAGAGAPTLPERLAIMCEHLDHMHRFYGLQQGVRIARKHIQAYLQRLDATALVPEFMRLDTAFAQVTWLSALTEATILEQQQRVKAKPPLAVNSLSC